MRNRIMQMYGIHKTQWDAMDAVDRKLYLDEKAARKEDRARRRKPPKFVSGMKIGMLTLLMRAGIRGYFRVPFHNGRWKVKCDCGKEIVVTYNQLQRGKYSCGCTPKPRKAPELTRPPKELPQRVYGRLIVHEYHMNFGWLCECSDCGDFSWVRYSKFLEGHGKRPCLLTCLDRKLKQSKRGG